MTIALIPVRIAQPREPLNDGGHQVGICQFCIEARGLRFEAP